MLSAIIEGKKNCNMQYEKKKKVKGMHRQGVNLGERVSVHCLWASIKEKDIRFMAYVLAPEYRYTTFDLVSLHSWCLLTMPLYCLKVIFSAFDSAGLNSDRSSSQRTARTSSLDWRNCNLGSCSGGQPCGWVNPKPWYCWLASYQTQALSLQDPSSAAAGSSEAILTSHAVLIVRSRVLLSTV